jgi:hypothetical protein
MAKVQNIKASVGNDQLLSFGTHPGTPGGEVIPGYQFVSKIHRGILSKLFPDWQSFSALPGYGAELALKGWCPLID